ncbi:hypothetical protein Btru_048194 [Bulinus truncatus]|nr:hypothetical protein Btru_048194 [Bulinus truncatus]
MHQLSVKIIFLSNVYPSRPKCEVSCYDRVSDVNSIVVCKRRSFNGSGGLNRIIFKMAYSLKEKKYTVLMIIGKTGNGKSACGNTILGNNTFKSNANAMSVTKSIGEGVARFGERIIKVIDTPGFEDTQFNEEEGLKLVTSESEKVLKLCPDGIHACLIVLRYGSRFTNEEKKTIQRIQQIFGENFLKTFCIIVMTYGDNFFDDHQGDLTFKQWVKQQGTDFKSLYDDCGGKMILLDNKKTDRDDQVRELFNMVDKLGGIYTDKNFEKARKTREAMMVAARLPIIRDETMTEVSYIFQELCKIFQLKTNDVSGSDLNKLKARAEDLLSRNIEQDKGTDVLHDLIEHVTSLISNINGEIRARDEMNKQKSELQSNEANMVNFLLQNEKEKERLFKAVEVIHNDIMQVNRTLLKEEIDRRCIVM